MVVVVDVDFKVPSFGAHQNFVVVVVLWWWTATLNGWRATATAGTRMSVNVDFCFPTGGVDVDFRVALALSLSLAHRSRWR
jgi:hypothetical protein